MVYSTCGSACPATCDNQNPFCIFRCTEGACNTVEPPNIGYLGISHFVLCWEVVLFSEVNNVLLLWKSVLCREVVPFSEGPLLEVPLYLQPNLRTQYYVLILFSGCFCPEGMVLDDDRCVSPENCPVEATRSPQEECAARGMVYSACGSACPATCDNPSPICTFQCVQGEYNNTDLWGKSWVMA